MKKLFLSLLFVCVYSLSHAQWAKVIEGVLINLATEELITKGTIITDLVREKANNMVKEFNENNRIAAERARYDFELRQEQARIAKIEAELKLEAAVEARRAASEARNEAAEQRAAAAEARAAVAAEAAERRMERLLLKSND